jgi:hypothetical protein
MVHQRESGILGSHSSSCDVTEESHVRILFTNTVASVTNYWRDINHLVRLFCYLLVNTELLANLKK